MFKRSSGLSDRERILNEAVLRLQETAGQIDKSGNDPGSPWAFAREAEIAAHTGRINAEVALASMSVARWTRTLALATFAVALGTIIVAIASL